MGPFETHLRDAIALNRRRAPHYARRTGGRSIPVSAALVGAELSLLPVARWYDAQEARWARRGVPLFDDLFAPMSAVADPWMPPARARAAPRLDLRALTRRTRAALEGRGFGAAHARLLRAVARLPADAPGCALVRHLLESARETAALAPDACGRAARAGLPSPAPLLASLLRLHLRGLPVAAFVDRLALPLQRTGVPILLADLPALDGRGPTG